MEPCGCKAKGRHSGECQGKPKPPPAPIHVLVLELKAKDLNSLQVYQALRKRGVDITLAAVNKLYASPAC